jgi:hypothetical protein
MRALIRVLVALSVSLALVLGSALTADASSRHRITSDNGNAYNIWIYPKEKCKGKRFRLKEGHSTNKGRSFRVNAPVWWVTKKGYLKKTYNNRCATPRSPQTWVYIVGERYYRA